MLLVIYCKLRLHRFAFSKRLLFSCYSQLTVLILASCTRLNLPYAVLTNDENGVARKSNNVPNHFAHGSLLLVRQGGRILSYTLLSRSNIYRDSVHYLSASLLVFSYHLLNVLVCRYCCSVADTKMLQKHNIP